MGNQQSIVKVNFEDIQTITRKHNEAIQIKTTHMIPRILINTLPNDEQSCLIKGTVKHNEEIKLINNFIANCTTVEIIIYGKNNKDQTCEKKYLQLQNLGFTRLYIYHGGLFEWLLLQDIYGKEEFPTTSDEIDLLRFKPTPQFIKMSLLEQ